MSGRAVSMTVLVLMYHKTPSGCAEDTWDVTMAEFRSQIELLREARHQFIRFEDIEDAHCRDDRLHVSVTFDDGHKSNVEAVDWLDLVGVRGTIFVVPSWSLHEPGFIRPDEFTGLAAKCDFGGHGFSHRALTQLSDEELLDELWRSRAFLEDATGSEVRSMSAPGGKLDARVVANATRCGYRRIGNSVPLANYRLGSSINRIPIRSGDGVRLIRRISAAGPGYWLRRRLRLSAGRLAARLRSPRPA